MASPYKGIIKYKTTSTRWPTEGLVHMAVLEVNKRVHTGKGPTEQEAVADLKDVLMKFPGGQIYVDLISDLEKP